MKKRLWMFVLLAQALAVHAAHAETDLSHRRLDNALSTPKLHKVSLLKVISHIALIFDEQTQLPLYNKNAKTVVPIASITKLMTAMVVLDARLPMGRGGERCGGRSEYDQKGALKVAHRHDVYPQ